MGDDHQVVPRPPRPDHVWHRRGVRRQSDGVPEYRRDFRLGKVAALLLDRAVERYSHVSTQADHGVADQQLDLIFLQLGGEHFVVAGQELVARQLHVVKSHAEVDGLPHDKREKLANTFLAMIRTVRTEIFGTLPIPPETLTEIEQLIIELLVRECFGPMLCGLVVAGFGQREYTPSLISFELEQVVLGHPRRRAYIRHAFHDGGACIIPFAQKDPVEHFLQGIDGSLATFMHESARGVVNGALALVVKKVRDIDAGMATQLEAALQPEAEALLKGLHEEWAMAKGRHWAPVIGTVSALPKDELAAMSEALVNLTKFRRRVNPDRETVGGPIDVAVITKGDGFIWIRRKHYFDSALNPRAMARYRREN